MFNEFIVDLLNCKCFFFLLLALLKCLLSQLLCSMIANLQIFLETFPCLLNIPARFYITGIYLCFFLLSIYFFRGQTTQLAISNYLLFVTLHIFCDISLYWSLLSINILDKYWSLPRE